MITRLTLSFIFATYILVTAFAPERTLSINVYK